MTCRILTSRSEQARELRVRSEAAISVGGVDQAERWRLAGLLLAECDCGGTHTARTVVQAYLRPLYGGSALTPL
jgi:hypothetical protein